MELLKVIDLVPLTHASIAKALNIEIYFISAISISVELLFSLDLLKR